MCGMATPLLSFVAPVFTDETRSFALAASLFADAAKDAVGDRFEIVFSDDGSEPAARSALARLAASDPRIRYVGDGRHRGVGAAVRRGLEKASGEYVLYTDGDGQISCAELAEAWPKRNSYDLLTGFRVGREEGAVRQWGTRILSRSFGAFSGRRLQDVDCSFKLAKAEWFRSLGLRCNGTGIDAEILWRAARAGARIGEMPVHHSPPGERRSRLTLGRTAYGVLEFLTIAIDPRR